ncbi:biotin carboxylase N-terminal domain-containing protein [Nocardioides sp. CER19]|uniref:acetyl/propionyl/methylcrotonyl-CoA carboxylase subunit alpha n=1 Tax=Nocardioides sp. CER19 TaxID=3038538 RepID=UPI00244923DA|nr:biotin carboxylase N-terminal domain-containing protein [Nocardioides sp. CER19]MDH2412678.1 biotin carboxylase N-terminal domain-containing protein [Nocardioides sp. CER19]
MTTISRVLVANRGEIASRVFRTCRRLGIPTVAVFSDADADLPYVAEADVAVRLPGNTPAETYLRGDLIVAAAQRAGADAVHPGYGFLSENASFARAAIAAGLTWIGPSPESIEAMGSKIGAKEIMKAAGVPVLEAPASPTEADLPLLVKASAGGGGRGMRVVRSLSALDAEIAAARGEAESAFGDGTVFVEPYVEHGRHVEVQLMSTTVIGDRDCSIQRRHQKVVEEAPAPGLPDEVRKAMHEAAGKAAEAIDYRGAGTVEFLYDEEKRRFWFLEMNTRLQVEHPVTEEVFGVDLVELQLQEARCSSGGLEARCARTSTTGHAIEVRLYAEDPAADYAPQTGTLSRFEIPEVEGIRVEAGFATGSTVTPFYDAMLAKVIVSASSREEAARRLAASLRRARIHGVRTNREQLVAILESDAFLAGQVSTAFLADGGPLGTAVTPGAREAADGPRRSPEEQGVRTAAALALAERAKAVRRVQQRIPVGWRNVTSQPQRIEFTDGTSAEWQGTREGYAVDGLTVVSAASDRVVLEVDGLRTAYDVSVTGDRVDVDGPLGHTALERVPRFVDPADQVAEGSLLAPMPGSVVAVHVEVGASVSEGQPLLVMEAMKMQHTIAAPRSGTVTELAASVGRQVEAGAVLAVVEEQG